MKNETPNSLLTALAKFDTCSIANAVDTLHVRMLNEGFAGPGIECRTKSLPPMVGIAMTLKVHASEPSMKQGFYLEQSDWWDRLGEAPFPRVLVIEDVDARPGQGTLVGPVHACIVRALGFAGIVTSGAVRGTDRFSEIGLHAFSANLCPSHAYCHVIEAGGPVEIAGLKIRTGDIVHGDGDGIVTIPPGIARVVPDVAARIKEREQQVCNFCGCPDFTIARLRSLVTQPGTGS